MNGQFNKFLKPVADRIKMMVARGVVKAVADSGGIQVIQAGLLADELRGGLERFQNYGFTSVPLLGADAAVVFLGGNRDHGIVLAVDDRRYRLKGLQPGEVAVYTDEGDKIVLKRGGIIEVTASTKVRMVTPKLEVTGDIIDNCDTQPRTVAGMRQIYNTHTHAENDSGGPTDNPNQQM